VRSGSRSLRSQTLLVPQSQNSNELIEWITNMIEADFFDLGHAVCVKRYGIESIRSSLTFGCSLQVYPRTVAQPGNNS
jgi:hypothetical protein